MNNVIHNLKQSHHDLNVIYYELFIDLIKYQKEGWGGGGNLRRLSA